MATYGLLGKNISYSFSKGYFTRKFEVEKSNDTYENFDIDSIEELPKILNATEKLKGFNVTIPYKESIIPFLDKLDSEAQKIGAVNTVKVTKSGELVGYNTDHFGFAKSLEPYIPFEQKTALILGTGGASKAIKYVLDAFQFEYCIVSRDKSSETITYQEINQDIIENHCVIINCTPLGTFPKVEAFPQIPYHLLTKQHLLYDLIYNPPQTEFLKRGFAAGAKVCNGLAMLEHQASKSWAIWKS
ncbi:MAG: shikimate dehydrogenase [Flavobacteriaceae bacterium]|nr:shikimate dehydrogenase [Flavobacteriaceae bacterium]